MQKTYDYIIIGAGSADYKADPLIDHNYLSTDEKAIESFIRQTGETLYHPTSTCKMGSDDMAVIDQVLKVHGIKGLRVVDASIMSNVTWGNTNAPTIIIGEKAADMILQSQQQISTERMASSV